MFDAPYFKADGSSAGERPLPAALFDGVVSQDALHRTVTAHLANRRRGTASAKTRGEVAGGNRKPWRQKGTGRARHGSIRSPIWEGGGRVFPPKPRSWRVRLPRKVKALARRSALNSRAGEERVLVVERLEYEGPKTRRLVEFLSEVGAEGKTLILTDGRNENLYLSARNLQEVEVLPFGQESAYDVLWAQNVVVELTALEALEREEAPVAAQDPDGDGAVETPAEDGDGDGEAAAEDEEVTDA